jgi:hypothetical protein
MNYIIDVREESELKTKRLLSKNPNIKIINVPTSIIKEQVTFINDLSKKGKVYLACRRGIRTNKIKNELFPQNNNVISIDAIDNAPKLFNNVFLIEEDSNILLYLLGGLGLYLLIKTQGIYHN